MTQTTNNQSTTSILSPWQEKHRQIVTTIREAKTKEFTVILMDGSKQKMRLFVGMTGEPCYFKKGSTTTGYRMDIDLIKTIIPKQLKPSDEYRMFHRNVTKAASLLKESGFWPKIQRRMADMATLTEDDYEEVCRLYESWDRVYNDCRDMEYKELWAEKEQRKDNFNKFFTDRGLEPADLYHFRQLRKKGQIISVPYSNGYNDKELMLQEADRMLQLVKDGEPSTKEKRNSKSMRWYGNYDYSVEFLKNEEGKLQGWYSAEYKGCGNGHYYLLLDTSHAIFYEDD